MTCSTKYFYASVSDAQKRNPSKYSDVNHYNFFIDNKCKAITAIKRISNTGLNLSHIHYQRAKVRV